MKTRLYHGLSHEELLELWREIQQQHRPTVLFHDVSVSADNEVNLQHYAFYQDDAGEASSTIYSEGEDTSTSIDVSGGDVAVQLRGLVDTDSGVLIDQSSDGARVRAYYAINSGTPVLITTTSSAVKATGTGSNLTDDGDIPSNRLSSIAGKSYDNKNWQDEEGVVGDGAAADGTTGASEFSEFVMALTFVSSALSDSDSVTFTFEYTPDASTWYAVQNVVTPTATISAGGANEESVIGLAGALPFRQIKVNLSQDVLAGTVSSITRTHFPDTISVISGTISSVGKVLPRAFAVIGGAIPTITRRPLLNKAATAGAVITINKFITKTFLPRAGALPSIQKKINKAFTVIGAGIPTATALLSKTFDATAGALIDLTRGVNLNRSAIGGGLTSLQYKVHKIISAIAAGIVDAVVTDLTTLTSVSVDALAGALPAIQKKVNLFRDVIVGISPTIQLLIALPRSAIAGAIPTATALLQIVLSAISGVAITLSKTVTVNVSASVGALLTLTKKVFKTIAATAAGLAVQALTALTAATFTLAATAGAIAEVTVEYIQFFPPFTGTGGFGIGPESLRQWKTWGSTWRKKTGRVNTLPEEPKVDKTWAGTWRKKTGRT